MPSFLVRSVALSLAVLPLAALAQDTPEIQRPVGAAQANGVLHTLRQIPEACTRLEGTFTGDAAKPYDMKLVRTSPSCQARAVFMDYGKVQPSVAKGWKLNDIIKVPSASCSSQQAVVHVWRKPAGQELKLDGQDRARIYLEDAKAQAAAGKLAALPAYAAQLEIEGKACR
ncbi:hypothetical protein SAMN05428989_2098 [Pseudoxanthomonas sp. GM95]|uniref:hypothetical protein n=1 Tax=Pseudoxanthomonas sp. GM95 TaxID=1881043 RepID=UPI0008C003B7|nr:hypothetical protein [Pseudoxanthomonas sp. GM95]SEL62768.1 hypothetical protein SAMN05428989_2098 [Pseudoxanthomonas sp. GM95]